MKARYFRSAPSQQPDTIQVDRASGVIRDLVMCRVGEARGHGVHLEQEFIDELVRLANAYPQGLKARFGHPAMCSDALGTEMGRLSNWRVVGETAIADLSFLAASTVSPTHGNMQEWVMTMAEEDPASVGFSIVFTPKQTCYYYDDDGNRVNVNYDPHGMPGDHKYYVGIQQIHGSDLVDEPAATDGMFSTNLQAETVTRFLDEHPEIFETLASKPGIVDQFLTRYNAILSARQNLSKRNIMSKKPNAIQKLLSALGLKKFDINATTSEGVGVTIITESDSPAVGDSVIVTDTNEPAPDGDHLIAGGDLDGTTITTVGGQITAITPAESPAPVENGAEDVAEQLSALQSENAQLRSQLTALKRRVPAANPTPVAPVTSFKEGEDLEGVLKKMPWNAAANASRKRYNKKV